MEERTVNMNQVMITVCTQILQEEMLTMATAHREACLWYSNGVRDPKKLPGFIISLDSVAQDGKQLYPNVLEVSKSVVGKPYQYDLRKEYSDSDVADTLFGYLCEALGRLYFRDRGM